MYLFKKNELLPFFLGVLLFYTYGCSPIAINDRLPNMNYKHDELNVNTNSILKDIGRDVYIFFTYDINTKNISIDKISHTPFPNEYISEIRKQNKNDFESNKSKIRDFIKLTDNGYKVTFSEGKHIDELSIFEKVSPVTIGPKEIYGTILLPVSIVLAPIAMMVTKDSFKNIYFMRDKVIDDNAVNTIGLMINKTIISQKEQEYIALKKIVDQVRGHSDPLNKDTYLRMKSYCETFPRSHSAKEFQQRLLLSKVFYNLEDEIEKIPLSIRNSCTGTDIFTHAKNISYECLVMAIYNGADVNQTDSSSVPPLFYAINGVKNSVEVENDNCVNTVRLLIEQGADLDDYKVKQNTQADPREMNAKEFSTAQKEIPGIYSISIKNAPRTEALFNDKELLKQNAIERDFSRRCDELGITKKDFKEKYKKIDSLRAANTFQGYYDAFMLSREKVDFEMAQKMAINKIDKKKIEYMAVIATKDKNRIFDIGISMGDLKTNSIFDNDQNNKILFFNIKSKSSQTAFSANTNVRIKYGSPVKLEYGYKLTIKYTLQALLEKTRNTSLGFFVSSTSKSERTVERSVSKSFVLKPGIYEDSSFIDFGNIDIAYSTQMFDGASKIEEKLKGEPLLTVEIQKVEMLNE